MDAMFSRGVSVEICEAKLGLTFGKKFGECISKSFKNGVSRAFPKKNRLNTLFVESRGP